MPTWRNAPKGQRRSGAKKYAFASAQGPKCWTLRMQGAAQTGAAGLSVGVGRLVALRRVQAVLDPVLTNAKQSEGDFIPTI